MKYIKWFFLLLFSIKANSQTWSISASKSVNFSKSIVKNSLFYTESKRLYFNNSGIDIRVNKILKNGIVFGAQFSDFKASYVVFFNPDQPSKSGSNRKEYFYNQQFWQVSILAEKQFTYRKKILGLYIGFSPTLEFKPSIFEITPDISKVKKQFIQEFNSRSNLGIHFEIPLIKNFHLGLKSEIDIPLKMLYVKLTDDISPLVLKNGISITKKW